MDLVKIGRLEYPGYGEAHLAFQKSLNRKVVLRTYPGGTARGAEQFRKEALRLAGLEDPRIVKIHSWEVHPGQSRFLLEYIEGESFAEHAFSSAREIVRAMIPICEAVDYIHNHGMVHRDLRPETLILDRSGLPRIRDFGLARSGEDQSLSHSSAEESTFRSPEQCSEVRGPVDYRSDIYSLGAILHWLMGKTGESPRILQAIAARAMSRDPSQRYASAAHLAGDLGRHLRGLGPARGNFWTRRRAALLLGLLFGGGVILGGIWRDGEFREQARSQAEQVLMDERFLNLVSEHWSRRTGNPSPRQEEIEGDPLYQRLNRSLASLREKISKAR